MTEFWTGPFEDQHLNSIIEKHMDSDATDPKLNLSQTEPVEYTERAADLWTNREKVGINVAVLFSRFQEIEQTCDLCRTAGLIPSVDNINKVLIQQTLQPLTSGDVKMLLLLAPWLYKLSEEVVLGKHNLMLMPLSPVNPVTQEWLITSRRMIMFASIINWLKRNQIPEGNFN